MGVHLAIQGGAMRGAYALGVQIALGPILDKFDSYSGTSASATNLAMQLGGSNEGQGLAIWCRALTNKKFLNKTNLLKPWSEDHTINLSRLETIIRRFPSFRMSKFMRKDMYFPITDVDSKETKYLHSGSSEVLSPDENRNYMLYTYLKAAMAIPGLFKERIEINGRRYVDGGMTEPIPINNPEFSDKKMVIISTNPHGYSPNKKFSENLVYLNLLKNGDAPVRELFADSYEINEVAHRKIEDMENHGQAIVVRTKEPLFDETYTRDKDIILKMHEQGKKDGLEMLSKIEEFMKAA